MKNLNTHGLSLQKEKEKSRELFKNLEMPNFKYGQGLQIDLTDLDLNKVLAKENEEERMTIEAPAEVRILCPLELSKEEQEIYWSGLFSPKENKILALHQAILNDVKMIIIPENTTCKSPIRIKSHLKKKVKAESLIIIAEKNTTVTIIEESTSEKDSYYKSQIMQVYAKDNALVEIYSFQNLSLETYNFTLKRGRVESNGKIIWRDISIGGKFSQIYHETALICPSAQTEVLTGYFGKENQVFDLYSEAKHKSSNTECILLNKGVLCDNARAITRGKIKIEKENKNCKAKQKSDNLLVDKKTRCDAVPILEVENDEVSCSHGVTITHLDEEKLFYLISRGIARDSAKAMLIVGFLEPIINTFNGEELQERIREELWRKINNE